MLAPTEHAPNSRPPPLLSAFLAAELGSAVMADDPCEAALGAADPTGPRNYYRARYYDPKIGRFLSEDPIRFAAGPNFYAYVDNNPTNYTDPMGLSKASCVAACTAAGAGAGAAAGAAGGSMAGATAGGMAGAAAGAAGGMGVGAIPGGAGGAAAGAAMGAAIGGTAGFITGMIMCESSGPVKCYLIGSGGKGNVPGAKRRCTYACDDGTQVTRYYADCPDEITK